MLRTVAQLLDDWIAEHNRSALSEGALRLPRCTIRVLGQTALMEGEVPLTLAATRDVDVQADYPHAVEQHFRRLLEARSRELRPPGHEIWMPTETEYRVLYDGRWVELSIADMDAILVSKALKAPAKNRALILEYLARGPSPRFLALAARYGLDLEALT